MHDVRYLLRVPCEVADSNEKFQELVAYCMRGRVDEVVVMVNSYELEPTVFPTALLDEKISAIEQIMHRFKEAGIEPALMLETTMGHGSGGLGEQPESLDFQPLVTLNGKIVYGTGCPLDARHRAHVVGLITKLAQLRPRTLWVEDDMTYLNKGGEVACGCPLHLADMSRRIGRDITRAELAEAVYDLPGPANEVKTVFHKALGESILALAEALRTAVDSVDPDIGIVPRFISPGLLASYECRDVAQFVRCLNGNAAPAGGPGTGFWHDTTPDDLLIKAWGIEHAQVMFGEDIRLSAEIESAPYGPLVKSRRLHTRELDLYVALRTNGLNPNWLNACGNPIDEDARWNIDAGERRDYLNALAAAIHGKHRLGIAVDITELQRSYALKARERGRFVPDQRMPLIFARLGVPFYFGNKGSVRLVHEAAIDLMLDSEIECLLSGGVLIDARGAVALQERGFGEHLGIELGELIPNDVVEVLSVDPLNGALGGRIISLRRSDLGWLPARAIRDKNVKALSWINAVHGNHVRSVQPGMTLYANRVGGRVGVYAHGSYDAPQLHRAHGGTIWDNYYWISRYVQHLTLAAMEWAAAAPPPAVLPENWRCWPIVWGSPAGHEVVVCVYNSGFDDYPSIKLRLGLEGTSPWQVERLEDKGAWALLGVAEVGSDGCVENVRPLPLAAHGFETFRLTQMS